MQEERLPIVHLAKNKWKGFPLPIGYTTEQYYDVEVNSQEDGGYTVQMEKKPFPIPVTHSPEEYDFPDKLYEDYRKDAYAWGVIQEDNKTDGKPSNISNDMPDNKSEDSLSQTKRETLLAAIETEPEEWSNRLRVTELWVSEKLRGQGYGHALMELAKEQARRERRRAIILETQSCNVNAIGFYQHEGFSLIGFDSCCYSNRDLERKEVRIELGWFPKEKDKTLGSRVVIRKEEPKDYRQTEEMTRRAFWNKHQMGCDEHYLVHKLREDEAYLPELSRVAELDGKIVGAILYSKSFFIGKEEVWDIVTFGPLCVDPNYQGCGIGARLLEETLPLAKKAGYPVVIIFGEPDYYPKHGFKTCDHFNIRTLEGKNFPSFLCYELDKEKLSKMTRFPSNFKEAPIFENLSKEKVEEYDKTFPPMEKQRFPGQWK